MTPSIVVFDIGGVLVDWQPHLAWVEELGSGDAAKAFMARIDFHARNARADNGESFADLAAELEAPEDQRRLSNYIRLYTRTVQHTVPGTWEVLERLRQNAVPLHAITNWSAETWPESIKAHPRLGNVFGTTVVSGQEGVMKPNGRIFQTLCTRAQVKAKDCVFVDDGLHNVKGAQDAGMDGIHFTSAAALADALAERGLL